MNRNTKDSVRKVEDLSQLLVRRIHQGQYGKNGRIESVRELARKFDVCSHTAAMAISRLAFQNIVRCENGRGTFVVPFQSGLQTSAIVPTIMQAHGHLYGDLAGHMVSQLQSRGYRALVTDMDFRPDQEEAVVRQVQQILREQPAGVILDGAPVFPFARIKAEISHLANLVVVLRNKTNFPFPVTEVLSDDEYGGYLGTRHLLELGHRRILILPWSRYLSGVIRGSQRAFAEYGIRWDPETRFRPSDDKAENQVRLAELLASADRPTAVSAHGDALAGVVYAAARQVGLAIPEQLSVVGYYNTPWAETYLPALTSITIHEEEIARLAVACLAEQMQAESRPATSHAVKPEVIVRGSSAPPAEVQKP